MRSGMYIPHLLVDLANCLSIAPGSMQLSYDAAALFRSVQSFVTLIHCINFKLLSLAFR